MNRLAFVVASWPLFVACELLTRGPDLEVTVDVQPSRFRPGVDTALITVAGHHRSDRELTVSGSGTCILRYEVWDVTGRRVDGPRWCTDDLRIYRIASNDSLTFSVAWSGQAWEVVGFEWREKRLESGTYRLVGALNANERQERSAAVEIELTQPPS